MASFNETQNSTSYNRTLNSTSFNETQQMYPETPYMLPVLIFKASLIGVFIFLSLATNLLTLLALVQGGRISCLQPSELAWYDWSLDLGLQLGAAAALRAAGSVGTRLVLRKLSRST